MSIEENILIELFVKNNKFFDYNNIKQDIKEVYNLYNSQKDLLTFFKVKEKDKDNKNINEIGTNIINSLHNMHHGYNKLYHLYCKKIYENINNEEMIIKIVKKIYENGGTQALKICNDIFIFSSPFTKSNNIIIYSQLTKLTYFFENEKN